MSYIDDNFNDPKQMDLEASEQEAEERHSSLFSLSPYRDPTQWFRASAAATACCIALYTLFGFILVSRHASFLGVQMQLFLDAGMDPLIRPDDPYLTGFGHRLGSALFFGCTLGTFSAMLCMALSFMPWLKGRFTWPDAGVYPVLGAMSAYLGFSGEMPVLSVLFGLLSPAVFFFVWGFIIKRSWNNKLDIRRWLILFAVMVSPFLSFIVFGSATFEVIRDAMLTTPFVRGISDFYYDHTLLAAHVIKPIAAQEQKVFAVSDEISYIGPIPHGTLWVITPDPCAVEGRSLAVSRREFGCRSVVLEDTRPANAANRIIAEYSPQFERNERLRQGIGLFFFRGPIILVPVLLMLWFSLFVSNLWDRSMLMAIVILAGYLALFSPAWKSLYQRHELSGHPDRIARYMLSEHEDKRYLALATLPKEFTDRELIRFAADESPRVRLLALFEAGKRGKEIFLDLYDKALSDPQLNVRTRACLALGSIPSYRSKGLLRQAFLDDPSWYVRGYAYRALGKMSPYARIVKQEK